MELTENWALYERIRDALRARDLTIRRRDGRVAGVKTMNAILFPFAVQDACKRTLAVFRTLKEVAQMYAVDLEVYSPCVTRGLELDRLVPESLNHSWQSAIDIAEQLKASVYGVHRRLQELVTDGVAERWVVKVFNNCDRQRKGSLTRLYRKVKP